MGAEAQKGSEGHTCSFRPLIQNPWRSFHQRNASRVSSNCFTVTS